MSAGGSGPSSEQAPEPSSAQAPEPSLVPELLVADIVSSLEFWCDLCGFEVLYERPEEGFAYLVRAGADGVSAHIMLEQQGVGRNWVTGELARPLGRGVNFQISVVDLGPIRTALRDAALRGAAAPLFMEPETKWYRVGEAEGGGVEETGVEQFLATDPDGYLIRFQQPLGRRVRRG